MKKKLHKIKFNKRLPGSILQDIQKQSHLLQFLLRVRIARNADRCTRPILSVCLSVIPSRSRIVSR